MYSSSGGTTAGKGEERGRVQQLCQRGHARGEDSGSRTGSGTEDRNLRGGQPDYACQLCKPISVRITLYHTVTFSLWRTFGSSEMGRFRVIPHNCTSTSTIIWWMSRPKRASNFPADIKKGGYLIKGFRLYGEEVASSSVYECLRLFLRSAFKLLPVDGWIPLHNYALWHWRTPYRPLERGHTSEDAHCRAIR